MRRIWWCLAVVVVLSQMPRTGHGCGTPPPPRDPPCVGVPLGGQSIILQLGTLFQTNTQSNCACGIGIGSASSPSPTGLDFSMALVGVVDTVSQAFTPVFGLNRNTAADAAWTGGVDQNGTTTVPGATWFGFSALGVPPVTPPPLGPNQLYAIQFFLSGPIGAGDLTGLPLQYGSGLGTPDGLPDFVAPGHPEHAAQYSGLAVVPRVGEVTWVPEPSTALSVGVAAVCLAAWRRARSRRRTS